MTEKEFIQEGVTPTDQEGVKTATLEDIYGDNVVSNIADNIIAQVEKPVDVPVVQEQSIDAKIKDSADYIPDTTEEQIQVQEQIDTEKQIYARISEKLGIENVIQNEEELISTLLDTTANKHLDNDIEAIRISGYLLKEDFELVRDELLSDKNKYGILSDKDAEDRVALYEDRNELEGIAKNIREKYEADLISIKDRYKNEIENKAKTARELASSQKELTDKIKDTIANYKGSIANIVGEQNMKAIKLDLPAYMLSGKYVADVLSEDTILKNPEQFIENAIWVNPKTREYLLNKIIEAAANGGKSDFIRDNLFGKAVNVGQNSVLTTAFAKRTATLEDIYEK